MPLTEESYGSLISKLADTFNFVFQLIWSGKTMTKESPQMKTSSTASSAPIIAQRFVYTVVSQNSPTCRRNKLYKTWTFHSCVRMDGAGGDAIDRDGKGRAEPPYGTQTDGYFTQKTFLML